MSEIYPKRILNSIAAISVVLTLLVLSRTIGQLRSDYFNLTELDVELKISILAVHVVVCMGAIALFFNKTWGWLAVAILFFYNLISTLQFALSNDSLVYVVLSVLFCVVMAGILLFLFNRGVRAYLEIETYLLPLPVIAALLLFWTWGVDVVDDKSRVNLYYLNLQNERFYFEDSLFTGVAYDNHPNKMIRTEGEMIDGLEEGSWKSYDVNGNASVEVNYRKGMYHGKMTTYFPTGELEEELNYFNGELHGNYELWHSPEEIRIKGNYNFGRKQGEWKEYELTTSSVKVEVYDSDTIKDVYFLDRKVEPTGENGSE